jgi:hypothetical protein
MLRVRRARWPGAFGAGCGQLCGGHSFDHVYHRAGDSTDHCRARDLYADSALGRAPSASSCARIYGRERAAVFRFSVAAQAGVFSGNYSISDAIAGACSDICSGFD